MNLHNVHQNVHLTINFGNKDLLKEIITL